jgi:hypothetical protein
MLPPHPHLKPPAPSFVFVSAYFPVPLIDHTPSEYHVWPDNLLRIFVGRLIFYTNAACLAAHPLLRQKPNIKVRLNYSSAWDSPSARGLRPYYEKQWRLDTLGRTRGPDVSAVYASKTFLVKRTSDEFPNSVVFWIDAGCAREKAYKHIQFPNATLLAKFYPTGARGRMLLGMWHICTMIRTYPIRFLNNPVIMAGIFGGDRQAILGFSRAFWLFHLYYMLKGKFVGEEQFVFTTIATYGPAAWIQPNYQAQRRRCDRWFSTLSLYTNPSICWEIVPVRHNSSEFIQGERLDLKTYERFLVKAEQTIRQLPDLSLILDFM